MRSYAFVRQPSEGMVDVVTLTLALQDAGLPVSSCTAMHAAEPYVVYVNADRELTAEELGLVQVVLAAHQTSA